MQKRSAAVIKAAAKLPKIKAVATMGAPSSIEHVKHLFDDEVDKIEKEGLAQVCLAGREFTIKKQFIEDISNANILDELPKLKKALLVMHSPLDDTVSIDHASKIFVRAKHPKSFVTLDNSNHLLMRRSDATYAGKLIGSWALRYISKTTEKRKRVKPGKVLVASRMNAKFTQDVYTSDHRVVVDEPLSYEGENLGMTPYQHLMAGLGACTSMTVKMYAERKGIQLDGISIELSHEKVNAEAPDKSEAPSGKIDVIQKKISIEGNMSPQQKQRLHEIAEKCPVNKTLQSEVKIISVND